MNDPKKGLFGAPATVRSVTLTERERELLVRGLQARICFIETGTPHLRAQDVVNQKRSRDDAWNSLEGEVKALSVEQMRLIVEMEDLIARII